MKADQKIQVIAGLTLCLSSMAVVAAHGASASYIAAGAGNWTDGANWSTDPDVPGATSGAINTDVATFVNPADADVQVDTYRNIGGITISNASNLALTDGQLNLTAAGNVTRSNTGGAAGTGAAINSDIILHGDASFFSSNSQSYLAFGTTGSHSIAGAGSSGTLTLNLAGTSTLAGNVIASSIGDGSNGGNLALVKTGEIGTWVLNGNNTYTGGTMINALISATSGAYLRIESSNALGTGPIAINSVSGSGSQIVRGTLQLAANIDVPTGGNLTIVSGGKTRIYGTDAPHVENLSGDNIFRRNIVNASPNLLLQATAGKVTFTGNFTNTNGAGGSTTVKPILLSGAGVGEISGRVQNGSSRPVGITKNEGGTWILSNPLMGASRNNYAGPTVVNAGTLLINTDNTLATGAVSVNAGGTLGGTGIVGGATMVAANGTLAPGSSAGILAFNANLMLATGSALQWELNANTAVGRGTAFDGLDFAGVRTLTIASGVAAELVFNAAGSTVDFTNSFWTSNRSWLLAADADTLSLATVSIFDNLLVSLDSLGQNFSVTNGSFSFAVDQNNDLYLQYEASPVPEPGGLYSLVVATSVVGMSFRRLRRNSPPRR